MILVTHNDLDGVGCEIVFRYFEPTLQESQINHCHYGNVDLTVRELLEKTNDHLVITDISISEETAHYIADCHSHRVELFDHHKTAQSYLQKYSWAFVDLERSATKIIFDTLQARHANQPIAPDLERLVFHINDYDLWRHTSPDSRLFNDLLSLLGKELFARLMLQRIRENASLISEVDDFYLQGLDKTKQRYFAERTKKALVIGNRLVLIASRYNSDLSQYIRNIDPSPSEWEQVDYIDILNFESGTHTLRSYKPGFDVSTVAMQNGGGGHPSASGCPMKHFPDLAYLSQL